MEDKNCKSCIYFKSVVLKYLRDEARLLKVANGNVPIEDLLTADKLILWEKLGKPDL